LDYLVECFLATLAMMLQLDLPSCLQPKIYFKKVGRRIGIKTNSQTQKVFYTEKMLTTYNTDLKSVGEG
jgi:hypothetical protein